VIFKTKDRSASTALSGDIATAEQKLAELEGARKALALAAHESTAAADRKALADHDATIAKEKQRIRDLRDAHTAALDREASSAHHAELARREKIRKDGFAVNRGRTRAASDIAEGAALMARGLSAFVAANAGTVKSIVELGAIPAGGALLDSGELTRAIAVEMWRISAGPDTLRPGTVLPGADPQSITHRDPGGIKPFADVVQSAIATADAALAGSIRKAA
jgi:hypothetical protein